jgi:transposase
VELTKIRPVDTVGVERERIATEFLNEVRRHDQALRELEQRIAAALTVANSTVTEVHGVGRIVAAYLIGSSGDIRRFPSAGHYPRYNATAPTEASSGPHRRHRLNRNRNRQLNHANHIARARAAGEEPAALRWLLRAKARARRGPALW